jgi:hypothetical protein
LKELLNQWISNKDYWVSLIHFYKIANIIIKLFIGDCYFLSSLSSLAENPILISRLFDTKDTNEFGLYGIWLNDTGVWKNVIVDDYFPNTING